jgi:hypothetical protein
MNNQEVLQDYICDIWSEIDNALRVDRGSEPLALEMWMNILGIFQSKADIFNIDRESIGLPVLDADQLFIQYSTNIGDTES